MQRRAGFQNHRISRSRAFPCNSVPYDIVKNQGRPQRILRLREQIREHDAAMSFVGHAFSIWGHHQPHLGYRINHGKGPQHPVARPGDRIPVHGVAVKGAKAVQFCAGFLGHAQTVTHGGMRRANEQAVRPRRDVLADHVAVRTEAAVSNDHRFCFYALRLAFNQGIHADAGAVRHGKRLHGGATN